MINYLNVKYYLMGFKQNTFAVLRSTNVNIMKAIGYCKF